MPQTIKVCTLGCHPFHFILWFLQTADSSVNIRKGVVSHTRLENAQAHSISSSWSGMNSMLCKSISAPTHLHFHIIQFDNLSSLRFCIDRPLTLFPIISLLWGTSNTPITCSGRTMLNALASEETHCGNPILCLWPLGWSSAKPIIFGSHHDKPASLQMTGLKVLALWEGTGCSSLLMIW